MWLDPTRTKKTFQRQRSAKGVEELTHRRGEEGTLRTFIDTTSVGDSGWGPLLVEGARGTLKCKSVQRSRAPNNRHLSTESQGQNLVEGKRSQGEGRRLPRSGHRAATREP